VIAMTRKPPWRLEDYGAVLAAGLLEFVESTPPEPPEAPDRKRGWPKAPPEPPEAPNKRRGRPKALSKKKARGAFLKAVAEIHSNNKNLRSGKSIAHALKKRPEYAELSERTLRRHVRSMLDWLMSILKEIPADRPDLWDKVLGISPPTSARTAKEKAFELLRHELRQHELLAKKQ
jgi:hypothetical protein